MVVKNLTEITNSVVTRCQSGSPELDQILGKTVLPIGTVYGFPMGYITYLSGAPGVGKTRVGIQIAKSLNSHGVRVMVFQGEVRPEEFKQWSGNVTDPANFFVSDDTDLKVMLAEIVRHRPGFVIIDSANMIDGFAKQDECREIFEEFKKTIAAVGCHCMMIGHLTKSGLTRGSSDVEHLVDVVCKLKHFADAEFLMGMKPQYRASIIGQIQAVLKGDKLIIWEVMKNRYGPSGGWCIFIHDDKGVKAGLNSVQYEKLTSQPQQVAPAQQKKKGFLGWLQG